MPWCHRAQYNGRFVEHELHRLLPFFADSRAAAQPLALALVLRTAGSTYRKPGAWMLIARDGRYAGLLSGGCLEGARTLGAEREIAVHMQAPAELVMVADSGEIGGDTSVEYMALADAGEASLVYCDECGFAADDEAASTKVVVTEGPGDGTLTKVETPGMGTIEAGPGSAGSQA